MGGAPVLRYFFLKKRNTNDFIVKKIIYFITGTLLKEEPCCKFTLTHGIKNYFKQFHENFNNLFPVKYNTRRIGNA